MKRMGKPKLFLFIGAPGAGKTTIAQAVAELTGAKHLWADAERHKLFPRPTHSKEESTELYTKLNKTADYLLGEGRSVVFDTNFNFYIDRKKLRKIAAVNRADTVLIWLTTPLALSKRRAVSPPTTRNGYDTHMSDTQFDDIVCKLEVPRNNEKFIKIDGTKLDHERIKQILQL
ncbi:MAG: ATP-binding protein [Patescibacteria group bacterium]|nr:ATP-binding protein [Patescibacteria group bacterium]